jgi:hypothetical protein
MSDELPPVFCSAGVLILDAPELVADGWQRRTVTDATRIGELEQTYRDLGFETRVTTLDPDSFGDACTTCATSACRSYLTLFTRRPPEGTGS